MTLRSYYRYGNVTSTAHATAMQVGPIFTPLIKRSLLHFSDTLSCVEQRLLFHFWIALVLPKIFTRFSIVPHLRCLRFILFPVRHTLTFRCRHINAIMFIYCSLVFKYHQMCTLLQIRMIPNYFLNCNIQLFQFSSILHRASSRFCVDTQVLFSHHKDPLEYIWQKSGAIGFTCSFAQLTYLSSTFWAMLPYFYLLYSLLAGVGCHPNRSNIN